MKRFLALLLACCLLSAAALADTLSLDGTVTARETVAVYAPIGGTVDQVPVAVGDRVEADTILAALRTTRVYAPESGTVSGLFAAEGDSADETVAKYGAVLYIEGADRFTVSATINNAYSSAETKFVHTGETVYLQCRNDSSRKGVGRITAVSGSGYTVLVSDSNLYAGDSVEVFRDSDCTTAQRLGRGSVTRQDPTAVTAAGSIAALHVKDGDTVTKGQLLLETLDGTYDGYVAAGSIIQAGTAGILTSLSVSQGTAVVQNTAVAAIAPVDALRIQAEINEEDLNSLRVGDPVTVELTVDEDDAIRYDGTVRSISGVATEGAETVTYTVTIDFPADDHVRLGMSADISTLEAAEAPAEDAEAPQD